MTEQIIISNPAKHSIFTNRWGRITLWFLVVALVATSLGIVGHIAYFYYRSDHVGHLLSLKEQLQISQIQKNSGNKNYSCTPPAENDANPIPAGLLSIPSIGLNQAPVVPGTQGPELNVAIGHVTTSVWPGQIGTSVLSAHDVTWFSHTPSLNPGDTIEYETACFIYKFSVTSHEIVSSQSTITNTNYPSLILDTCWPINALYLTNTRYLTFSKLISEVPNALPITTKLQSGATLNIPASPALASAAKFTFPYLPFPLGVLSFGGNPSTTWEQSTGPTDAEVPTVEDFYDAIYSAQHNNPTWFSQVAPTVPFKNTGVIQNSTEIKYVSDVNPTLIVQNTTLVGYSISGYMLVIGGNAPGKYSYTVTATVTNKTLYINSFQFGSYG
jgi:sortase A